MATFTEERLPYAGATNHTRTYTCTTCGLEMEFSVEFLWHDELNGFTRSNLARFILHAESHKA